MVTWGQVRAWRLERQFLVGLDGGSPVDVAGRLCGVQAQVPSAAVQAIVTRQRTPDPGAIATALEKRRLVRTWAARGTLHLLTPEDAPPVLSLLAAAKTWEKGSWQKNFITVAQMAALGEAVDEALDRETPIGRAELLEHVLRRTEDDGLREHLASGWSAVLKPLAWQGRLMQGPSSGGRVSFVRPDRWVPDWPGLPDPDEAAGAVIERYLGAFGPASPAAFDQWLLRGSTAKPRLRAWFARLREEGRIAEVDVEGERLHLCAEHVDGLAATRERSVVRLLPGFDQYVLGPGTTDPHTVPPEHRTEVSRAGGWIAPVVVVGGQVVGTWSAERGTIATSLFTSTPPLTTTLQRLLVQEVERVRALSGSTEPEA